VHPYAERTDRSKTPGSWPMNSEPGRAVSANLNVSVSTGLFPGGTPLGVWTLQTTYPIAHPKTYSWYLRVKFYTKMFAV
jgi:hypothetical protein